MACGNNRQRGKIALAIFRKLGYIKPVGTKGNSTRFKLTGKKPIAITLDEILRDNNKPQNKATIKMYYG
jgi:hypothetical protein